MKANKNIFSQPWAIMPEGAAWVVKAHQAICERQNISAAGTRPENDIYGQPLPKREMRGIAGIVPIKGVILNGADSVDRLFGFVNPEDVIEDINAVIKDGAKVVVLDINSPGGTVAGTPELAEFISQTNGGPAPVFAWSSGLICSAAYYLAAGANHIFAQPSATIGSIGVIMEHLDASEYFAQMGLRFDVFTSGKFKATGHPGIPLTDEQSEFLQSSIDATASDFKSHVQANRPDVADETMQGQWFSGKAAKELGLIDDTRNQLAEVVSLFG